VAERVNVAGDGEHVPLQIGWVLGRSIRDGHKGTPPDPTDVEVTNVRSGNATVGVQADVVTGPIVIRMGRR